MVNKLGLKDATLTDFLNYLEHIKDSEDYLTSEAEKAKISLIYRHLNELAQEGAVREAKEEIRYVYFNTSLHYLDLPLIATVPRWKN
jgi:hypothetical protein